MGTYYDYLLKSISYFAEFHFYMNVLCEQVESSYILLKNMEMKMEENAFIVFCKVDTIFKSF